MPSTFEEMKRNVETGWDIVLWSKSYGIGEAAKVGPDLLKQDLENKGKIFGAGQFEVEAKDAYWSTYYKVWNLFKRRHEIVTTDR